MSKNYDIKTKSAYLVGSTASSAFRVTIGGAVPAGMTRFVTFLRVVPVTTAGNKGSKMFLCSTTASDTAKTATAASAAQKMVVFIGSATAANRSENKSESIPATPDTEHPLFTVAAEKFLSAYISTAAGQSGPVNVFVQYFDE